MITAYIDGASKGNPGEVGIGYIIYKDDKILKKDNFYLGTQTNNFAEYMALIFSLIEILNMGERECSIFSDSELLCEQIKGNYKVKNKNIYSLYVLAINIIKKFKKFNITHINREENKEADKLSKEASNKGSCLPANNVYIYSRGG